MNILISEGYCTVVIKTPIVQTKNEICVFWIVPICNNYNKMEFTIADIQLFSSHSSSDLNLIHCIILLRKEMLTSVTN